MLNPVHSIRLAVPCELYAVHGDAASFQSTHTSDTNVADLTQSGDVLLHQDAQGSGDQNTNDKADAIGSPAQGARANGHHRSAHGEAAPQRRSSYDIGAATAVRRQLFLLVAEASQCLCAGPQNSIRIDLSYEPKAAPVAPAYQYLGNISPQQV